MRIRRPADDRGSADRTAEGSADRTAEGSVATVVVLVLPVLFGFLGWGSHAAVLATAERELQHVATSTALAAAAELPLMNLGALDDALGLDQAVNVPLGPVGIDGGATVDVDDLFPEAPAISGSTCAAAEASADRAPIVEAFAEPASGTCAGTGITPPVTVTVTTQSDVLGPTLADLQTFADLLTLLTGPTNRLDVASLLPAIAAPRVRVDVSAPMTTPFSQLVNPEFTAAEIEAYTIARRTLKNAILLPSTALECQTVINAVPVTVVSDLLGPLGLPIGQVTNVLYATVTLSGSLDGFVTAVADGDFDNGDLSTSISVDLLGLINPTVSLDAAGLSALGIALLSQLGEISGFVGQACRLPDLELNSLLQATGDAAFALLFDELLGNALQFDLGVQANLLGRTVSADLSDCVLSSLRYELESIYDPPGASGPTVGEIGANIVREAQAQDEDVLVILTGLAAGSTVPILDAIPVAADALTAGSPLDITTGRGIFRSTLIEEGALGSAPPLPGCGP